MEIRYKGRILFIEDVVVACVLPYVGESHFESAIESVCVL